MCEKQIKNCTAVVFVNQNISYDLESGVYSSDYLNLIDFLFEASNVFEELHLCMPVGEGVSRSILQLPQNVQIIHLPYYHGPTELLRNAHRIIPRLLNVARSEIVREADIIGTVVPSTLGAFTVPITYYAYQKPHFLLMRGDKRKTVAARTEGSLLGSLAIRTPIRVYDSVFSRMSREDDVALLTIGDLSSSIVDYGYQANSTQIITPLVPYELLVDEFEVDDKVTDLLYVGRLSAEKGVEELLEGFEKLVTTNTDLHLHIVGSGPQSTYLQQLAGTLEIDESVTFHGFIPPGPELWSCYDKADLFLLFSLTEGLPRVVAEAMSRGTPVITSAVGGLTELIDSRQNGLLVESENIEDFVTTVEAAIRNKQLRTRIAAEGHKTATELTFKSNKREVQTFLNQELLE